MQFGWRVFPLLFCLSLAAPAFADPVALDPAAEAKRTALFEEGRKLHLEGKHAEAVSKLEQVVAIRKSPQALRALGLAELDAGRAARARGHFAEALAIAQESGPASEIEPAQKALDQSAQLVGNVRVTLPAEAVDATFKIDGQPLVLRNGSVDVDPGEHTITADAAGKSPFSRKVAVVAGKSVEVTVTLEPLPVETSPRRTVGLVLFGVGAAGLVAGGVTGALALVAHDDLSHTCANGLCADADKGKIDAYHTLGLVSTVSLIAGGALAVGGGLLWWTAPHGPRPPSRGAVHVTPYVGLATAGVRGTF
ncbi:MAG: hypothetical protein U0441_15820 [Polyangiaceae bacterium]